MSPTTKCHYRYSVYGVAQKTKQLDTVSQKSITIHLSLALPNADLFPVFFTIRYSNKYANLNLNLSLKILPRVKYVSILSYELLSTFMTANGQ